LSTSIRKKKAPEMLAEMTTGELRPALRFAENIVDTVREPLLVLDEQLRVINANRPFYQAFASDSDQTVGKSLFELSEGRWDIPELRRLLEQTITQRRTFEDHRIEHRFAGIGFKKLRLNARHLQEDNRDQNRILLAIEDVTDK
jgi:PAS domain-containing protein